MKKVEITLYKFKELSEEGQQKALKKLWDINVDYEWWEYIYDDAERIGLQITSFDNYKCEGRFIESGMICAHQILEEHGKDCDTYKVAETFISDWTKLVAKYSNGVKLDEVAEDNYYDFDGEADELEKEFLKSLLEEYRVLLNKEYEYLTSKESIIETIESNDYDFTENGESY